MAAADLPKDRFTLTDVYLNNTQATDADLAQFKEFKGLTPPLPGPRRR